jgi:hypothetical protein
MFDHTKHPLHAVISDMGQHAKQSRAKKLASKFTAKSSHVDHGADQPVDPVHSAPELSEEELEMLEGSNTMKNT